MTIGIQVTFDAANPEKLAAFWAVALDYILEPPPPGFDNWQEFSTSARVHRTMTRPGGG